MDIARFVESTYAVFESFEKPEFATDIHCCPECRDHNDEVAGVDRRALSPQAIGTPGWGITSFLTPQAMAYYIPRFIELAVSAQDDKDGEPFMCLFINQVGLAIDLRRFALFSSAQRKAVHDSLLLLKVHYSDLLAEHCWDEELDVAIQQWGDFSG